MEPQVITRIFQQLFSRPSRRCLYYANAARRPADRSFGQHRTYSSRRKQDDKDGGSPWQQRIDAFPRDMSRQLQEYPRVTARDLQQRNQRPRRVKMYARDFIEVMPPKKSPMPWHGFSNTAQTASTTRSTGTSRNTRPSSAPASPLTSPPYATVPNSTALSTRATSISRMPSMRLSPTSFASSGTRQPNSSGHSTVKPSPATW